MNGSIEEHDPPSPQSVTGSNISIESADYPEYFIERHGRTFHSSSSPYYLPADEDELARLDLQHEKFKSLLGGNTFGPVAQLLAAVPGQRKRVLDLGSGSGLWIREMAEQYGHVRFIGIDLFPAPEAAHPPSNAHFECYDLETRGLVIRDSSADLIHCRCICSGIRDFRRLMGEAYRVLRPNGLVLSAELDFYNDVEDSVALIPATRWVLGRLRCYAQSRGLAPGFRSLDIPAILESEGFTEVTTQVIEVPLGDWMQVAVRYMTSIRPAVLDAGGYSEREVDGWLHNAVEEIQASSGIAMSYILTHGKKSA